MVVTAVAWQAGAHEYVPTSLVLGFKEIKLKIIWNDLNLNDCRFVMRSTNV